MDKYVNEREVVSLPETEEDMAKKTPEERMKELEAENKRLSKALELERLRSEACMISSYDFIIKSLRMRGSNRRTWHARCPNSAIAVHPCFVTRG